MYLNSVLHTFAYKTENLSLYSKYYGFLTVVRCIHPLPGVWVQRTDTVSSHLCVLYLALDSYCINQQLSDE